MARVYTRASAMPGNAITAGGSVDVGAGGSSAGASAHLTLTAGVGLALLAIVIFLPRVM